MYLTKYDKILDKYIQGVGIICMFNYKQKIYMRILMMKKKLFMAVLLMSSVLAQGNAEAVYI